MTARASSVPREAAQLARELRVQRRTRSGLRWRPWAQITRELERRGLGRFAPADVADAVAGLPVEGHALAPLADEQRARIEASWREGWAEEFPGEPWPGLELARERVRAKWAREGGRP